MGFTERYAQLWDELGESRVMVLATANGEAVSARSVSVVMQEGRLLFQTDLGSRKYAQLKKNPRAALCWDNVQIEGECRETGRPQDHPVFCELFSKHYPGAFARYTLLENERLFCLTPAFIRRWLYVDGAPFVETFDPIKGEHTLTPYSGL